MSDPDAPRSAQAQIAEAIRAKRERRSSQSIQAELEAMETALLADINSFDLDAVARRVRAEEEQFRATGLIAGTGLEFPDILAGGATRVEAPDSAPARQAEAVSAPVLQLDPGGGLLEQLRNQAEICLNHQNAEQQHQSLLESRLDHALRQVFAYLHELVQQLNVIKPPIARNYLVAGSQELQGLVWQQGFADYRSRPQSAGAAMESVSFSYRLAGQKGLVMERDGTVAEKFGQALFDLNLDVKVEEFRNERRYLERARFTVLPEIKVNVRWEADLNSGTLRVLARNLERLGSMRYSIAPEAVNRALLDEFGRMVLGQPHQFPRLLSRC